MLRLLFETCLLFLLNDKIHRLLDSFAGEASFHCTEPEGQQNSTSAIFLLLKQLQLWKTSSGRGDYCTREFGSSYRVALQLGSEYTIGRK